jgi:hypothetical protein
LPDFDETEIVDLHEPDAKFTKHFVKFEEITSGPTVNIQIA